MGEKEKRTSKKNVDGRSTSSHDNKKFRTRSMEKQRGMAFGLRKTATAVKKTGQMIIIVIIIIIFTIGRQNIRVGQYVNKLMEPGPPR